MEEQADKWGAMALKERKEDDRKNWEEERKTTVTKTKRADDTPKEQKRQKRRRYALLGEQWGEEETVTPEKESKPTNGVSPTALNSPPCMGESQEIQEVLEIQRPSAVKQTSMTDFISVRDHPVTPGDDLVTTRMDGGGGSNETENDISFASIESQAKMQENVATLISTYIVIDSRPTTPNHTVIVSY